MVVTCLLEYPILSGMTSSVAELEEVVNVACNHAEKLSVT